MKPWNGPKRLGLVGIIRELKFYIFQISGTFATMMLGSVTTGSPAVSKIFAWSKLQKPLIIEMGEMKER